jgi:hypothetical protein
VTLPFASLRVREADPSKAQGRLRPLLHLSPDTFVKKLSP